MKKILSFLMMMFMATSVMFAAQGGTLSANPAAPIDPTATVTLTYDGAGTNFANWQPECFIHTWLVAKSGQTLSKTYETNWVDCSGSLEGVADNRKMTYAGTPGKYTISMNIKSFFGVEDADLEKIAKIGVIVCSQYNKNGDSDKTNDMFLDVAVPASGEEEEEASSLYLWDGIGVTTAAAAKEIGGEAEAVQASGTNIEVGVSQKGNFCLKVNKGFSSGANYLGIALDNAVNAGDTIRIAYFRTSASSTFVLGMDFSANKASVATTYQILSQGDPQVLSSNGTPADSIYIVPEGVKDAKYVRIYRNSGSTGLWVAKFELLKKAGEVVPPAPECQDGPYGLIINETDTIVAKLFDEVDGAGRKQYQADSVEIKAGDKIVVANLSCEAKWVMDVEEFGAFADFEKSETEYTAKKDGMYVFFIKMSMEAGDIMYIGEIVDEPVTPECQDGPYGLIINETDTIVAKLFDEVDGAGRKQYQADSVEIKAGDKIVVANLSCEAKWVMDVEEYGAFADFEKSETEYTAKKDGMYVFFIKMSMEAGDIMYIGEIVDEPVVPECQDGPYGLIINETDTIVAKLFDEVDGAGRKQYQADSVEIKAGDKIVVANLSCEAKWVMDVEEFGAFADFEKSETEYTAKKDGMYVFFIKMSMEAGDIMYIGEITDEPVVPECQDGPYGLIINETDTIIAKLFDEVDGAGRKQYQADSVEIKAGDKIVVANLSCEAKWVMDVEEFGAFADFEKSETEYTAKKDGMYVFFIKMSMEAGDIMYIGEIVDEPVVPECQDGPYGLIFNETDTIIAKLFDEVDGAGRKQYQADSVEIKAGDKIVVANLSCEAKWVMDVEEFGAYADFEKDETEYTAKKDGMYVFFIKMSMEAGDIMYIGEIVDEPVVPECQDGPYGLIINETDTIVAKLFDEVDGAGRKQYQADSVEIKAGDKIVVANLSCEAKWVMDVEEFGAFADFEKSETEYTAKKDGMYVFFIKMSMEAGDIMYIGEIVDEPVVPECQDGPYGLIFNGTDTIEAKPFAELDPVGRKQYQADSVEIKAGDKIVVANLSCEAKWVMDVEEFGAFADFEKSETEYTAKKDGMYVFFIKMSMEAGDIMYIGEIVDEPVTPEGYYLVGTFNDWNISNEYKFVRNGELSNEFMIDVTLTVGDGLKVVTLNPAGEIITYYPNNDFGSEYVVDAEHAGEKTIYFNPYGNTQWTLLGGYIWIEPNGETTGFDEIMDESKAMKVLRDGQILIIKGNKTFNIQGQLVK